MSGIELDGEIDRLYALSLDEFTGARGALAARLRREGDRSAARKVKALAKPSVSAWAVNQLHHRAPEVLEALRDAGEAVRAAQRESPADLPAAMKRRRDALAAALGRARALLAQAGRGASDAVVRRMSTTLEAIAAYGRVEPPAPGPGRLVKDLDPPGFEVLAGFSPAPPAEVPDDDEPDRVAEARAALVGASASLDALRRRAHQLLDAREKAEARLEAARAELAEAQRRVERATERVAAEQRNLDDATADAERVAAQTDEALAEMESAQATIDALASRVH